MLANVDATLVLCGHISSPREYHDQLPDGRDLHVVRADARDAESVGYAVLTRRSDTWHTDWHSARIVARA